MQFLDIITTNNDDEEDDDFNVNYPKLTYSVNLIHELYLFYESINITV